MADGDTTRLDSWIDRIGAGDATAYNELLIHFGRRLEALASKMLRGFPKVGIGVDTGDVHQEASLRLHAALKALAEREVMPNESKSFHTADFFRYAAKQVQRELLTLAKKAERRWQLCKIEFLPDLADLGSPTNATWNPVALSEWSEFHQKAAELPEKVREVFELLYYDGLDQAEAAALLGVSVRMIKRRWQDARLQLIEAVGGRLPGL